MKTLSLFNIPISTGGYHDFIKNIIDSAIEGKSQYVCVANVHMLVEAYNDPGFAKVLDRARVVTPDGLPLTWAMRLLYGFKQERVAGMDLMPDLLREASQKALPVFFYGGTEEMLIQTKQFLQINYPQLLLAGTYSPPFRKLTNGEDEQVVSVINSSGASIVFVALGCPKQEKWMSAMKGRIKAEMIGIGAALPVLIGVQSRAPLWMQRYGFEWLYRFTQEPKRLFKRYAVTNTKFLYLLCRAMLVKGITLRKGALKVYKA